jgi:hypothetical protein
MNLIGIIVLAVLLLAGFAVFCVSKQRLVRLTGLASVAIALAIAGFFFWQLHRWNSGFDKIHIGESREQVRQIMGVPTEATDATIGIYGSKRLAADRVQGCTEQYWYYPFFTPECWWIAFDAHGSVLTTFHYVSP